MTSDDARFKNVLAAIDAANARDPRMLEIDGRREPYELIYGRRMSETLARMAPDASDFLRIAARGQHVERWTSPRTSYPEGRVGYLIWRRDLKDFHARRVGEIMAAAAYDEAAIARVGALVRKERLKHDAEAQMLEDVICVVFLEHYLDEFKPKTEPRKMGDILAKTWGKMSALGHAHALKLSLPPEVTKLLQEGLARLPQSRPPAA
jgi:hypothetical protein